MVADNPAGTADVASKACLCGIGHRPDHSGLPYKPAVHAPPHEAGNKSRTTRTSDFPLPAGSCASAKKRKMVPSPEKDYNETLALPTDLPQRPQRSLPQFNCSKLRLI